MSNTTVVALIALVLGGGVIGLTELVLALWDRFHPRAPVCLEVRYSEIPKPDLPSVAPNAYAEITVRNRSRADAEDIGLTVYIPTNQPVHLGEINTTETPGTYSVEQEPYVQQGQQRISGYVLTARAKGLGLGSKMTIPLWYAATEDGEFSVKGSMRGGLIKYLPPRKVTIRQRLRSMPGLWVFVGLIIGLGSFTRAVLVVGEPVTIPRLVDHVVLPTTYPTPPRLTLVDPNTVKVMCDSGCSPTLLVADAPTGEFRPYYEVPMDEPMVHLAETHGKLWLRAYATNRFGRSLTSDTLEVPMSGLDGEH